MMEPMEPEEAWDRAIEAAAEECMKNATRDNDTVGARNCFEIQAAILALRGGCNE